MCGGTCVKSPNPFSFVLLHRCILKNTVAVSVLLFVMAMSRCNADIITLASAQWTAGNGGNDHWYSLVEFSQGQVTWDTARTTAETLVLDNRFGHLATFTSDPEWIFARDTLLEPFRREFDQGWLGATDRDVEGVWVWVTGEPFLYSTPATFDNLNNEDYLMAWRFLPNDPLQWNDVNSTTSLSNRALIEFGGASVPEPNSAALLTIGTLFITSLMRRRNSSLTTLG